MVKIEVNGRRGGRAALPLPAGPASHVGAASYGIHFPPHLAAMLTLATQT